MSSSTQLDANQVIKKVYDDTSGGLSTVAAAVGPVTLLNTVPAGTSITSTAINILPYKVVGVMVSWAGLNTVDATVQFQGSVDGSLFVNIGSATTLAAASGAQDFGLIDEPYAFIRLVYTHGTDTAGIITAKYMARG